MASGPRSALTWMERCLRSRDFDVGIESSEASRSAVNLSEADREIITHDVFIKDHFLVLGPNWPGTLFTPLFISPPPGFKDKESPMDATASKVGSVFREINMAQPFHHPEKNQNN